MQIKGWHGTVEILSKSELKSDMELSEFYSKAKKSDMALSEFYPKIN